MCGDYNNNEFLVHLVCFAWNGEIIILVSFGGLTVFLFREWEDYKTCEVSGGLCFSGNGEIIIIVKFWWTVFFREWGD